MSFTLDFTLKQHTPILHFQHDQPGATLRATEVKPKLDKFILETFQNIFPESAALHKTAIAKIQSAFNDKMPSLYKIRITQEPDKNTDYYYFESNIKSSERETVPQVLQNQFDRPTLKVVFPSPFFANADKREKGKWDEIRLGVFFYGDIFIQIRTWDDDIHKLLKEAVPLLFCVENFGMRQSKGFGSFSEKSVSIYKFEEVAQAAFVFTAKTKAPESQPHIFRTIDNVYKTLRYNNQEKYSALEKFLEGKARLEKYKITQEVVFEEPYTEDKNEPVRFIRSVLGLPGLHDYPNLRDKPKVNIRDVAGEVERYKSPIMFKIFESNLYLLATSVNEKMLQNREFIFYVGENPDKTKRKVKIPTLKSFSIKTFLEKYTPTGWETL
ncbi:MAG: hypothetical protein OHK0019_37190 [Saprospiraceae bacterium]